MINQEEIHKQCLSDDSTEQKKALRELADSFISMANREQAWDDLHRLTSHESNCVRGEAASAIGSAFLHMPDKQKAWDDLIRLTNDKDLNVMLSTAKALGSVFSQMPDKQQAWNDLHRLTNDKDFHVRLSAAKALKFAFSYVPDKEQAWNDLIRLTNDEDRFVRCFAVNALGSVYSQMPDKQQAWNDLHRLTNYENSFVRFCAAEALGHAFSYLPDKQTAWSDLHRLTNDKDLDVRSSAAEALGHAFSYLPNKQQAWDDIHRLTQDANSEVRSSSNHSLGKVSIFKASQAETDEDYKKELEKAIGFFEKASKESFVSWMNPSEFCLPFYRSFHTILFKNQEAKEEVSKYLAEAKEAIGSSKSKELLLEAIENLANALKEVQSLEKLDLQVMKGELNYYRIYCNRASELMRDTEKEAPFATATLKKGLPILNRNLKAILEEIQEKAKRTYRQSKGTVTEEIAYSVCREVQKWEIGSQEEMTQKLEDIAYLLKMKVADLPENEYLLNKVEAMKHERNLVKQYDALLFVIGHIPTIKVVSEQELDRKLDQKLQKFDFIFDEIIYIKEKLSCISFDISKIKLNSADVLSDLKTMKEELEKLSKIEGLSTLSIEKLDCMQTEKLSNLNSDILKRLDEIKILICEVSKGNDELYQEYSRRLDELKQSKLDTLLQRYSAAISLISFVISGIQIAR